MARKSFAELLLQLNVDFADNNVGAITPALLRGFLIDFLDAIAPAYGYLSKLAASSQLLGLAPVVVTFTNSNDSDPAQTTSQTVTNRITRAERGTSVVHFTADLECNAGRFVTFTLFKNGVATPWQVTGNGGGAGNPVAVSMTAVDYADPSAFYDIRAVCEVAATTVTLSNVAFVLTVYPVRDFI